MKFKDEADNWENSHLANKLKSIGAIKPPEGIFEGVLKKIEKRKLFINFPALRKTALALSSVLLLIVLTTSVVVVKTTNDLSKKEVNKYLDKITHYLNSDQSWIENDKIF